MQCTSSAPTPIPCSHYALHCLTVVWRHAAADAAAYICNGEAGKSAHSIATATAEAFALAVASASATCEAQGNANFKVAASASAKAAANVWVKAYAAAFASAGDCKKCDAYAESFGKVEKDVFLKAVANAEAKVCMHCCPALLVSPQHDVLHCSQVLMECSCQGTSAEGRSCS
jgi:cellobiose-specific phosphotransferase system component IIB